MNRLALRVLVVLQISSLGCAQVMASRQAAPLDRGFLQPGAERGRIVATLGAPAVTDESPDRSRLTETYNYTDGGGANSKGAKAARILLYTAGDIFTAFLSQIIWMPMEMVLDGTDYSTTVEYRRRRTDHRWVAARVTETELEGDKRTTVLEEERVVFVPPVVAAPPPARAALRRA